MKFNRGRWKVAFRSQKLITEVLEGAGSAGRPDLAESPRNRSEGFDAVQTSKECHKVMRSLKAPPSSMAQREARPIVCSPWSSGLISGHGYSRRPQPTQGLSVEITWHEEGIRTLSHGCTSESSYYVQRGKMPAVTVTVADHRSNR